MKTKYHYQRLYALLAEIRDKEVRLYSRIEHPDTKAALGVLVTHTQNAVNRAALLAGLEKGVKRRPLKNVSRGTK